MGRETRVDGGGPRRPDDPGTVAPLLVRGSVSDPHGPERFGRDVRGGAFPDRSPPVRAGPAPARPERLPAPQGGYGRSRLFLATSHRPEHPAPPADSRILRPGTSTRPENRCIRIGRPLRDEGDSLCPLPFARHGRGRETQRPLPRPQRLQVDRFRRQHPPRLAGPRDPGLLIHPEPDRFTGLTLVRVFEEGPFP